MSHAASQTHATATQTTPHRLLYFFVAFVLLMFFGLIYAWSLFVDPLEAEFGWDRSATSVVFTLSIITFCAGMLVAGALEERTSPRTVMLITAACLGLGLIASAFTESLPFIYATYGVLVSRRGPWHRRGHVRHAEMVPRQARPGFWRHAHGLRRRHHVAFPRCRLRCWARARMAHDFRRLGPFSSCWWGRAPSS